MIVKNEARNLPACVESLRRFADEICVVDTGSEDGTLALARELGCVTGVFDWCGDFAAARNAALAQCRCDWIFVADADERIAAGDAPRIRALTGAGPSHWYSFITRNYTHDEHLSEFVRCAPGEPEARGYAGWFPSLKVRLFPRDPENRFVGRVHELLRCHRPNAEITVSESGIPVHHYPLDKGPEAIEAKRRLYLALGRKKLEESPDCAPAWAELAVQHVELGEYAEGIAAYRNALRLEPLNAGWLRELGAVLLIQGNLAEARTALEVSLKLDPDSVEAWRNLGVLHFRAEAWGMARAAFEQAIALAPEHAASRDYLAMTLEKLG